MEQSRTTSYGSTDTENISLTSLLPNSRGRSRNAQRYAVFAILFASMAALLVFPNSRKGSVTEKTSLENVYEVSLYQTSKYNDNQFLEKSIDTERIQASTQFDIQAGKALIEVNASSFQQEIFGFGAAFTDAAAINFFKLPEDVQSKVIELYFGIDGIGYSFGRVPMNSCDFSIDQYNFDDVEDDFDLEYFDSDVSYDQQQRIPLIKKAMALQPDLKILVSPWSPPPWMKVPVEDSDGAFIQTMIGSAYPEGMIDDPNVKAAWALYFSKYISAYKASGIKIWGVTIQNEPENPGPWEACVWNSTNEASFLADHLGPILRRDHPDVNILAYDHNKDHMVAWTEEFLGDPNVAQYLDGMAFHWYFGGWDRGLDGAYGWENVKKSYNRMSDLGKFVLSSESCHCPNVDHTYDGSWYRAEKMGHDIIADILAGSTGWIDWNLLLDFDGGPNHQGNLCDSPIYANELHTDIYVNPMYYYMGHISKFVPPGSVLLSTYVKGQYNVSTLGSRSSNVLIGFELSLWPCDNSVRQRWQLTEDGHIMLLDQMTEAYKYWNPVCLSSVVNEWTEVLNMVTCDDSSAGVFEVISDGNIKLSGQDVCLSTSTDSSNQSLSEGASQNFGVTLTSCDEAVQWNLPSSEGGNVTSMDMCLTAGWPWLTSASFLTPDSSIVVVVLNEAEESVEFSVSITDKGAQFETSIPSRSIQTYVLQ